MTSVTATSVAATPANPRSVPSRHLQVPLRPTRLDGRLAAAAAMYAVSEASLVRVTGTGGAAYLALQISPSARAYRRVIEGLDARARRELRNGYHANFHHPVLYATALRLGAVRLAELVPLAPPVRRALLAAPAVAAGADLVENLVDLRMLADVHAITTGRVYLSNTLSVAKWTGTLVPLGYMTLRFGGVWAEALGRLRRGSRSPRS